MFSLKRVLVLLVLVSIFAMDAKAQCAMCRGAAETSLEAGNTQAAGINAGVLYVLVIVLTILSAFGYLIWKNRNADGKHQY